MTIDKLLQKLPSCIGRNSLKIDGKHSGYVTDHKSGCSVGNLYLTTDGFKWIAYYGYSSGEYVCLNPDAKNPPYNNAVCLGSTANEALQGLYDWCVKNGFINDR